MLETQLVMYEEDHRRILAVLEKLADSAHAKGLFLLDKNGQLLCQAGELISLDTTSLASLAAGSIAATGGLAKLIGEDEFPVHFYQGQRDHLHINVVAQRFILVVIFDDRSSLGLVRLRVRRAADELGRVLEEVVKQTGRSSDVEAAAPFNDITDEDIDNLFSR